MKKDDTYYAIVLTRRDGSWFYAHQDAAPRFFLKRATAQAFNAELKAAGCRDGKIVKVRLTVEQITS